MLALALSGQALAQDDDDEGEIEEIVVTGSQIKGARINEALAVSVFSAEDIELLGIESGEELLDAIPEMGQNFFNETDTAGSVNAARGDSGAINLRNLGTGNTLTLLNGRRLVNMATYQTEEVGGAFVPVNSVNSRHIPVYGLRQTEVLDRMDGSAARNSKAAFFSTHLATVARFFSDLWIRPERPPISLAQARVSR